MDQQAAFLFASYARLRGTGATCSLLHHSQGGVSRSTLTLDHGPLRPPSAGPPAPPLFPHPHHLHPHLLPRDEDRRQPKHRGPSARARDKTRRSAWLAARQASAPHNQNPPHASATEASPSSLLTRSSSLPSLSTYSTPNTSSTSESTVVPPTFPTSLATAAAAPPSTTAGSLALPARAPTTPSYVVMTSAPRMSLVNIPTSTTTKTTRKSVAEVEDHPRSPIHQLDGQLDGVSELCELVFVKGQGHDMDGADLPLALLKPPSRVKHWDPKHGIGYFVEMGDYDDLLIYDFPKSGDQMEIGCNPMCKP